MNPPNAEFSRAASLLRLARYAAVISAVLLAIAGPAHRLRILPFEVALKGPFLIGVLAALVAFLVAGVALLTSRAGRSQPQGWRNWLTLLFGAVVVIGAAYGYGKLRAAPLLHDVSTDTKAPPPFVEAGPRRAGDHATNSLDYLAEYEVDSVAINAPALQQEFYPDLKPIPLRLRPPEAFAAAEKALRAMHWELVAIVPAEGRIEATVTSPYFGLRDDIAIRVRSERNGRGSIVDVRSSARVGANDGGSNARHIRAYAERLIKPN
ncbi:MAG: DUF1499 domain-containing protein [Steroidobacterales bacterium]